MKIDTNKLSVAIDHPHGEIIVPMNTWIEQGPGERPLLAPSYLIYTETGEKLSLEYLPWKYRNSSLQRLLVRFGLMPNPW